MTYYITFLNFKQQLYHFHHSHPFSNPSHTLPLNLLPLLLFATQIDGLFVCTYAHIHTIYTHTQPTVSLQWGLCVLYFRADHFVLDNKLGGSSLGKVCPYLRCHELPLLLHLGEGSHGIFLFSLSMSIHIIFNILFRQLSC